MLVITRRPSESVQIGDNVVITITEVRGKKVRIGIDAPRDVLVHRLRSLLTDVDDGAVADSLKADERPLTTT